MTKRVQLPSKQIGAATLIITVMLMVAATMMMFYAAQYTVMQQKSVSNQYQASQAFEAGEGGLEFGVAYLNLNSASIIASAANGYINYGSSDTNITNVTLADGSQYSVVYTNPTQNNYQLITITSTGTSKDGTSTRVVSQQVYAGVSSLKYTITTQQNLTVSGNVNVTGGSGVDIGGTLTKSGVFKSSGTTQPDSALANMSADTLFKNIFGVTTASKQSSSEYHANTSGIKWSTLSGSVWINSSVVLSGNNTIGTVANPVLLMVNGDFISSGSTTINGILYVMGTTTASGNFNLNGGLVSLGSITTSGSTSGYNESIVSALTTQSYAKLPGSWKDF